MLPPTIVGSVITKAGPQPFVLDGASGRVTLGSYQPAHPKQSSLGSMERQAIDKQLRAEVAGVQRIRLGELCCPVCSRWVDVVSQPDAWNGDRCARC